MAGPARLVLRQGYACCHPTSAFIQDQYRTDLTNITIDALMGREKCVGQSPTLQIRGLMRKRIRERLLIFYISQTLAKLSSASVSSYRTASRQTGIGTYALKRQRFEPATHGLAQPRSGRKNDRTAASVSLGAGPRSLSTHPEHAAFRCAVDGRLGTL